LLLQLLGEKQPSGLPLQLSTVETSTTAWLDQFANMKPSAGMPRKKDFKKGTDVEDARRKREDNIIELRKTKRDENLQKKRMVHGGPSYAMEESSARTGATLQNKVSPARISNGGVLWTAAGGLPRR
jgi:hypothetical protein